jgi:hypothetical protein
VGYADTLVDLLPFAVHAWLGLGAITAGVPGPASRQAAKRWATLDSSACGPFRGEACYGDQRSH